MATGDEAGMAQAQADYTAASQQSALWADDGAARITSHAVVAGLGAAMGGGSVAGAVGGTVAGDIASNQVSNALRDTPGGALLSNVAAGLAGAAAGGALGGSAGAMSGANGALAADLFNRKLHPEEVSAAEKLADASGGKYTQAQIENQMALMNLTQNDQTYDGSVRVAVGTQPNDGTTWVPYGTNQAGQQVWAQNLPGGDADIQSFIVQNANGLGGSSGMTYQATTNKFTQYSASVSGTVMLPFVGGGGGWNFGVSTDGTAGGTSPYIQAQANGMASAGAYAGVSGSVGISHTNGQLTSGASTGGYAEMDAGFGPSGGGSFSINDDGTIGGIGGSGPVKVFPGAGFGAGIGAGVSKTWTFVVPSLNDLFGSKK
ncbi:hypothetical protein PQR12_36330 [Paraburkholderia nemoris]|uniref:hypothetical protein n=1 Tax=Paraburkholderia nemoris TaxID=2793076 RepID=UPI0038B938A4